MARYCIQCKGEFVWTEDEDRKPPSLCRECVACKKAIEPLLAILNRLKKWAEHETTAHQRPSKYTNGFVAACKCVLEILNGKEIDIT